MNRYQISIKALKKKIQENKQLTESEWDEYARENTLFSSFTLQAHQDVISWKQLKLSLDNTNKKIEKQIEKIRKSLHKSIEIYGLTSNETIKLNHKINKLIYWYYTVTETSQASKRRYFSKGNFMYQAYQKSYQHLKEYTKIKDNFPTVQKWNEYAMKKTLLSSQSMEFVSGENWNELRKRILRENNNYI